jgi:hypothetical protein
MQKHVCIERHTHGVFCDMNGNAEEDGGTGTRVLCMLRFRTPEPLQRFTGSKVHNGQARNRIGEVYSETDLDKPNGSRLLAEALTAQVKPVLANETSLVGT